MNSIEDIQKMFIERLQFFAKENEVEAPDIKILIFANEKNSGEIQFNLYVKDVFKRVLRAKEDILNLDKFDFLQKEFKLNFALGVLTNALMEWLRQKRGECTKTQVRVQVFVKKTDQQVPYILVSKEGDEMGEFITWEQLEEMF